MGAKQRAAQVLAYGALAPWAAGCGLSVAPIDAAPGVDAPPPVDSAAGAQPCADPVGTPVAVFDPARSRELALFTVEEDDRGVVVIAIANASTAAATLRMWQVRERSVVALEDVTLGERVRATLREWDGGWTLALRHDAGHLRVRSGGGHREVSRHSGSDLGGLLASDAAGDLFVRAAADGAIEVRVWTAGGDVELIDATDVEGTADGTLEVIVGTGQLVSFGSLDSPRGPWRGSVQQYSRGSGWSLVSSNIVLFSGPSPDSFGWMGAEAVLLQGDGTTFRLREDGPVAGPILSVPHVARVIIDDAGVAGVGLSEDAAAFLDGSEVRFDLPVFFWTLDTDLTQSGGQRPLMTGTCTAASLARMAAGGFAVAHDCVPGQITLSSLCAERSP